MKPGKSLRKRPREVSRGGEGEREGGRSDPSTRNDGGGEEGSEKERKGW